MAAIGRARLDDGPPSGVESASRQRVSLEEILWVPLDAAGSLGGGEEPPAQLVHRRPDLGRADQPERHR